MWGTISGILKTLLLKLGKTGTGFWGWLASIGVDVVIDKVFKPLYKYAENKIKLYKKKKEKEKLITKYKESKNEKEFNNTFDDLP